jgi:uncharacterized phage protein gp47/JayE
MFERKSMEQLLQSMVTWVRGTTWVRGVTNSPLTDFRVGAKIRTLLEAVAIEVEKLYDRVYRSNKEVIETNLYSVLDFDKLPAVYANGIARFGRSTPSDDNYLIAAGTIVTSKATATTAPIKYATTRDGLLGVGFTTVDIPIVCLEPGIIGNQTTNAITEFVIKPIGIETVTNFAPIINGREEETKDEQKVRFGSFIQSRSRGTLESCEYGASLAVVKNEDGVIIESIRQALAMEDTFNSKGEFDIYLWNGAGTPSEEMFWEVHKLMEGYKDPDTGEVTYGYKPAGIQANLYSAVPKNVMIKLFIKPESWTTIEQLTTLIDNVVFGYFSTMKMGQSAIHSAIEANVKFIDGVQDVKLYFQLVDNSGVPTEEQTQENIPADEVEVLVVYGTVQYSVLA